MRARVSAHAHVRVYLRISARISERVQHVRLVRSGVYVPWHGQACRVRMIVLLASARSRHAKSGWVIGVRAARRGRTFVTQENVVYPVNVLVEHTLMRAALASEPPAADGPVAARGEEMLPCR